VFESSEGAAAYRDRHDSAALTNESTDDPDVRFVPAGASHPLTLRLDGGSLVALREQAWARGVRPAVLARLRVLERLQGRPA
jgi:hypothetical protein